MPLQDTQQPIGYVNTATAQAMTEAGIRAAFPNTSFPRPLPPPEGFAYLYAGSYPVADPATQTVSAAAPALAADGKWRQQWAVRQLTAEEQAAASNQQATVVRGQRNAKLAESDWTQLADAPVDSAGWAAYRQALRDVPGQPGFPWTVDWPVKP